MEAADCGMKFTQVMRTHHSNRLTRSKAKFLVHEIYDKLTIEHGVGEFLDPLNDLERPGPIPRRLNVHVRPQSLMTIPSASEKFEGPARRKHAKLMFA
jgi:hypothetical protein